MAGVSRLGEMDDHASLVQRRDGVQREQAGIAGAYSDTDQAAVHSPSLASALTAAAVMALPPIRPRTMRYGTPRALAASASFDSAAPTKPTGMPRMAAGFGAPSASISSRRNRAVGALPMATTAPFSLSRQSSSAAAERVVPSLAARSGTLLFRKVQITSLLAGRRARVTPCATISASHRIGAPSFRAARAAVTRSGEN